MTELRYVPGTNQFSLHDVLTNHADYPHDYQIIYHSNFGADPRRRRTFLAPAASVSPFNDYAKAVNDWQTYAGPTKGFDEMVFNIKPLADKTTKRSRRWSIKPVIKARQSSLILASCPC
jgi:hypothetical protein